MSETKEKKTVVYENANDIPTKVITKKQTPETDEARHLLNMAESKYSIVPFIPLIIFITCLIFCAIIQKIETLIYSGPFCILLLIFCISFKNSRLKPYYELLEVAEFNDKLRHEERIRFRERKRLEADSKAEIHKIINEPTKPTEVIKSFSQGPVVVPSKKPIPTRKED